MKHAKTPQQVDSSTGGSFEIPATQAAKQAPAVQDTARDSRISKETSANAERYPLFCDEKSLLCEQAQGSYLSGNDRRACEAIKDLSRKAESNTPKANATKPPMLCGCAEFEYIGKDPYTLRLTSGHTYNIKRGQHFIVSRGNLANFLKFKKTLFKLVQQG